jgi:hypothetical protein
MDKFKTQDYLQVFIEEHKTLTKDHLIMIRDNIIEYIKLFKEHGMINSSLRSESKLEAINELIKNK